VKSVVHLAGSTLPATRAYLFPCRPFKVLLWVHRSLLIIHSDRLVKTADVVLPQIRSWR
jgi:hypothetical protein